MTENQSGAPQQPAPQPQPQQPAQPAPQAQQPAPQAYAPYAAPQKTSGLAVAGLVLGILSIFTAFIPLLNLLGVPLAVLGLVLAIVGLVSVNRGKSTGRGIAIAGIVLGALALVVTFAMYGIAGAASDSHSSSSGSSDQPAASQSAESADSGESEGDSAAAGESQEAAQEAPASDYEVTIDGARMVEDYQGNPAVIVTYSWVNNSDDATSFMVALNPKVFQNGVELSTAIVSVDYEGAAAMNDVKPGAGNTVEYAYELTDTSDVTVEVYEMFSWDDTVLAEKTFTMS